MSQPVQVILNPFAGSGAARRLLPRLGRALHGKPWPHVLHVTRRPGHATRLARDAALAGAASVLAVGGDGTVHEVVNGLLTVEDPPPLTVLPVGTGNDFHRLLGPGRSIAVALDRVESGSERYFDVGVARWGDQERIFVNVFGVGVDTAVLDRRDAFRRLKGLPQYLASLGAALASFEPLDLRITIDGSREIETGTTLTSASVGPTAGGGFHLSPGADPEDGLLDLLVVRDLTLLQILRYLPRVMRGTHESLPVVETSQFRRLHVQSTSATPFPFELDGELMPDTVPAIDIEVLPACLPVLTSRREPG